MLVHCLRRRPNFKPTYAQRLVFAGPQGWSYNVLVPSYSKRRHYAVFLYNWYFIEDKINHVIVSGSIYDSDRRQTCVLQTPQYNKQPFTLAIP